MRIKSYAPGGKVDGPSHEQDGVPTIDQSGQQVAEIEGDERIFSVEDTEEIEGMVVAIIDSHAEVANKLATDLGYRVVDMVQKQEEINPSSPTQGQPNFEEIDPALAGLT